MTRLQEVRDLHAPRLSFGSIVCKTCLSYDGEPAEWPCSTAEIVYSPAHAASVAAPLLVEKEAERAAAVARREKRQKERAAGAPATMEEQIADIYSPIIEDALKGFWPVAWQGGDSDIVTFKRINDLSDE